MVEDTCGRLATSKHQKNEQIDVAVAVIAGVHHQFLNQEMKFIRFAQHRPV